MFSLTTSKIDGHALRAYARTRNGLRIERAAAVEVHERAAVFAVLAGGFVEHDVPALLTDAARVVGCVERAVV
jgi:hypothetical protein